MKMLKFVTYQIANPLSHLFSLSISTGVFQAKLKLSKTIPIFKAGDHACCDNYRQISLLSSISKVFEKIVANTFVNHLEINKLLCDNQYGFLRERSTVHNITKLTRKISHDLRDSHQLYSTPLSPELNRSNTLHTFPCREYGTICLIASSLLTQ